MINYGDVMKENIKDHNPNWSWIPDNPCRILIIGGSWSWKTNVLLNLIQQDDYDYSISDKVYLYGKHSGEAKYQYCINKHVKKMFFKIWKTERLILSIKTICRMSIKILKSQTQAENVMLFFKWDSLHTRLNSHYKAWSYKKKKHKKIKAYRKSLKKEPTVNRCPLTLHLKPFRS